MLASLAARYVRFSEIASRGRHRQCPYGEHHNRIYKNLHAYVVCEDTRPIAVLVLCRMSICYIDTWQALGSSLSVSIPTRIC